MKNDKKISNKPPIAYARVFLPTSTFFGSPLEVINLIPPTIIKINATVAANNKAQYISVAIKGGIQESVAAPLVVQAFQFIIKS